MKHAANIITGSRMVLSAALLMTEVFSLPFRIIYILCGLSDMIDGSVARKTGSVSLFGERLDSAADICFLTVCAIKLLPTLDLPRYIIVWTCCIAFVRISDVIIVFIRTGRISLLHTRANKLTGFLLFAFPLCLGQIAPDIAAIPVCLAATYAAVDDCVKNMLRIGKNS